MSKHSLPIIVGPFDVQNSALCSGGRKSLKVCPDTYCPRHRPENYADTMARHALDSL